ncbi:hypothetical protein RUE5091_01756 [Ruegeria denitrificans]|uniref:Uncharacterized protein n=1 Tax=Ruegeria denitrificans TaxID=1715692 RepID=A0A0P1I8I2_9RHOB|nr:hypothetical protein [Ruegeria denitrificans]CUJ97106.1 hypothetical protein RUE5091_01756 [Ruegeria denitrificans]
MCTIGAINLDDGNYYLFKNKDFGLLNFDEHLISDPSMFGVSGVENFAATDDSEAVFSGLSIGANEHGLLCCNAHVSFTPANGRNYDILVEIA